MNPVIYKHVLPLVGRVHWDGFNKDHFGSVLSLRTKIVKHIAQRNGEKLCKYIALCMTEWKSSKECPIESELIKEALEIIEKTC
jgi:hypothetical protein